MSQDDYINPFRKYELQGIFYMWFPRTKQWLYTVRESVKDEADAKEKVHRLSRSFDGQPARVIVQDWNFPKSNMDRYTYSMEEPKEETE